MPSIIKEVFFPPEAPQEVATLIESSLVYQNSANYMMAIKATESARQIWRDIENPPKPEEPVGGLPNKKKNVEKPPEPKLRPEQELFFEMSLGSIYESSGKDDIALSCYMRAKTINKLLAYNHPDQAFAFCGLGSVLFHIDEPAWALRCYLKAREIREERLGGDTVDTATVYTNLGACMYLLERNQESKAYFELAHAILDSELGPHHERTLTVSNLYSSAQQVSVLFPSSQQKLSSRNQLIGKRRRGRVLLVD